LVLEKDNPSGLPENAGEFRVPVNFSPVEQMTVKAFFSNNNLDPEISCTKVFPVERNVPKTEAVARAALEELLKGVTNEEKDQGYFTSINPGVQIQKLTIEDGIAQVDFDQTMEEGMGGSCRVSAIRAEITETLKQFPTVKEVIISVGGRTEDILQP
jgi:spore germination protein GerM